MQTVRAFKYGDRKLKKYHVTMTYVGYPEKNKDFSKYGNWTPVIVVGFNPIITLTSGMSRTSMLKA